MALHHTAAPLLWSLVGNSFVSYCSTVAMDGVCMVGKLLCVVVSAASATIQLLGLVWLFQQVAEYTVCLEVIS